MKRLTGFILILLTFYSIYFDLSSGTLPVRTEISDMEFSPKKVSSDFPFFEQKVQPGDTVLSILESNEKNELKIPLSKAITDFKDLNDGIEPNKIQSGQVYKFPDYSKSY